MITFSFLMENFRYDRGSVAYNPKYPLLYYGTIAGSGLGGGLIGYSVGEDYFKMNHPGIGALIGSLNGLNVGLLAGEYIDRKKREIDNKPYNGPRKMNDAGKEFLLRAGIGNAATIPIAATGSSLTAPAILSARLGYNLAPIINDRLTHLDFYKEKAK